MKLDIINLLRCPNCEEADPEGKYKLVGDYNQDKIFDGHITCRNGHSWQVRDEILRFHKESHPEILYDKLDIDENRVSTLPDGLDEQYRRGFREGMLKFVKGLDEDIYAVTGLIVPFVKALGVTDKLFILFSENEDELRLAQEVVAKNRVYDNFFFVRHKGFILSPLTNITRISLFCDDEADTRLALAEAGNGEILTSFGNLKMVRYSLKQ